MAASNSTSTREKLLGLVDDIELITKEILENAIAPKAKRLSSQEHEELTTLLIQKDATLKETMKLASEQGDLDNTMKQLQDEVQKQDNDIKQLQKQLKEAETVLSTAIYQARQKLDSIQKAKENPVSSEELIKYAHRISASNAVSAPHNWQQGDPRRPYPTDVEMRIGLLGRPESAAIEISRNAQSSGERGVAAAAAAAAVPGTPGARTPSSYGPSAAGPIAAGAGPGPVHPQDFHHPSPQHHMGMGHLHPSPTKMHQGPHSAHPHHPGAGAPFSWQQHGGTEMSMGGREGHYAMDSSGMHHYQQPQQQQQLHGGPPSYPSMLHGGQQQQQQQQQNKGDDVEVMSTDSSSSSSTDSN